ncbi:putative NIPA-like protein 1 [Triangularia verruculosa]|uniref:NIPA-like protein 1 n=1 Tax=Triangularia verruculosa TaxID=2587418 RepID=A0AAN7AVN3_9PEZI|nr:putative NIPA-like protein 1 [Triangularia verruculosa]
MEHAAQALDDVHQLYIRAGGGGPAPADRPPAFKAIGIGLAIGSGAFIGTSFVLKKVGLLRANEKYNEAAGEGYGYLKNFYWWAGMILMILGEGLNFAAYAFTDAILVTPLGALSVVITTVLSAIFLKERLSMVGKVACFLCIVGSVVIVMNAPQTSAVKDIHDMQNFVVHPLFLSYAGVVIVGCTIVAFWLGPKYGAKNMMVYISICSWIGGLSVVATQGLGAAIIAQAGGTPQFNQWFLYVLLVFVIATLLTEIIYLNKALNLFNAALVTPTYYVYFTSTTIITSAILFRGFKGTPTSIITVVMGFLVICSGVVLLQLSKSAKDVPDTAVFAGDLDQIQTIAEQPQPETEPKADAIRGAAAIVRRLSAARQKMEMEELKRLHEEKLQESLAPVSENGAPLYEWDGLRRRRTGTFSSHRTRPGTGIGVSPAPSGAPFLAPPTVHPPLGWSRFPTEEELAEANRPVSPALSSIMGTIRSRARSVLLPGHPDYKPNNASTTKVQSPMHPVQLTSIVVPGQDHPTSSNPSDDLLRPLGTRQARAGTSASASSSKRRVQFPEYDESDHPMPSPPTPPPHSARRQFSFQNIFRRNQNQTIDGTLESGGSPQRSGLASRGFSSPQVRITGATEEERLGLVKPHPLAAKSMPTLHIQRFSEEEEEEEESEDDRHEEKRPFVEASEKKTREYGHSITQGYNSHSPPRKNEKDVEKDEVKAYEERRQRFHERRSMEGERPRERNRSGSGGSSSGSGSGSGGKGRRGRADSKPPPPPTNRKRSGTGGGNGEFI